MHIIGQKVVTGETDSIRKTSSAVFSGLISKFLDSDLSFEFSLDSVKNLSSLYSADHKVRILTWSLMSRDHQKCSFYGEMIVRDTLKKQYRNIHLIDKSDSIPNPVLQRLSSEMWYGAVYYKIIDVHRKDKTYYTLLGWHSKNAKVMSKVIDVLSFTLNKPTFGFAIFKMPGKRQSRVIFNYSSNLSMSLHFDEKSQRIIFDSLSPSDPNQKDNFEYYGPDGRINAFKFKKGNWNMLKDIDARNPKEDHTVKPPEKLKQIPVHNE